MITGTLAVPAVVHKPPKTEKHVGSAQSIIALASSLKSSVEEVVQAASKSLQDVKEDPYGYANIMQITSNETKQPGRRDRRIIYLASTL